MLSSNDEVAELNRQWRSKPGPTNVLSFPATRPGVAPAGAILPLGDIILAHGVVAAEANAQGKTLRQHLSHLVVHGILHLLGHNHLDDEEAGRMESLEIAALEKLGLANPYEEQAATGNTAVTANG